MHPRSNRFLLNPTLYFPFTMSDVGGLTTQSSTSQISAIKCLLPTTYGILRTSSSTRGQQQYPAKTYLPRHEEHRARCLALLPLVPQESCLPDVLSQSSSRVGISVLSVWHFWLLDVIKQCFSRHDDSTIDLQGSTTEERLRQGTSWKSSCCLGRKLV